MPDSPFGELDFYLMREGSHPRLWEKLGARLVERDGERGAAFAVWAPNAEAVEVVGDFNGWAEGANRLSPLSDSGVWTGFVPGAARGSRYKYRITTRGGDVQPLKADPFGFWHESGGANASVVWDLDYQWHDEAWLREGGNRTNRASPLSIYEVHLGSWMRDPSNPERLLGYAELAPRLVDHVRRVGFTHVEFMPLTEHPFYGSWGYETTGYFAATSRYGTPQELMALIDALHQADIGVILDWVPAHFPTDAHGLARFDGTHLFEHADPRQGFHPDWHTAIFNYGRNEVRDFLLSSALFWLEEYHADGLRVDGVASMLYLDYGRREGEWIPNREGGRENLEAVSFLRQLNDTIHRERPGAVTFAEESTAWPKVTGAPAEGGLGFDFKWDMGWMHDTLRYFAREPIHRRWHHGDLTFRGVYAYSESFVLPLSHDEVVHGKGALVRKMSGDDWQKFANLRVLFAYMYSQPGKKLLFMGAEMAQSSEWNHDKSLDWHLLSETPHRQIQLLVGELNRLHRTEPSLFERDTEPGGFAWIDADDAERSVLSYERVAKDPEDRMIAVLNLTPVPRENYRIGVNAGGKYAEVLNTDAKEFGGSGRGNLGGVEAAPVPSHGRSWSLTLSLPPLAAVFLRRQHAPK